MTDPQKKMLSWALGILIFLVVAVGGYFGLAISPVPVPLPSPDVSASVLPSPSPTATPTAPSPSPVASVTPLPVGKRYRLQSVTTTKPSFIGAPTGQIADVLVPDDAGTVIDPLPPPRSFPFYVELQAQHVGDAFKIPDTGPGFPLRVAALRKAIQLYRDHGIEPIKQAITGYPLDWDTYGDSGGSFRQLVITGAIYPPCVAGPSGDTLPPVAFMQKVEAAIRSGELPPGTWWYAWDEGEGDPVMTAKALARVKLIRANVPSVKVMLTRRSTPEFAPYVDIFVPVFEAGVPGQWMYGACMSQGSCTNGVQGTPTGSPMMVMDAPDIHPFAYPIVAAALGAKAALYYNGTERLATALNPDGQYISGGQGDGTLMYAGTDGNPWPSARMLRIKQGLAYIATHTPDQLKAVVSSWKVWEKDRSKY